jgi:hypothetical protein
MFFRAIGELLACFELLGLGIPEYSEVLESNCADEEVVGFGSHRPDLCEHRDGSEDGFRVAHLQPVAFWCCSPYLYPICLSVLELAK